MRCGRNFPINYRAAPTGYLRKCNYQYFGVFILTWIWRRQFRPKSSYLLKKMHYIVNKKAIFNFEFDSLPKQ